MTSLPPEPPMGSGPQPEPPVESVPPTAAPPPQSQQWSAPPPEAQEWSAPETQQWSAPETQQWSAPPPGAPAPASGERFNAASVKPTDWGILAAGVLAFVFSFLAYYSYSLGSFTRDFSAWDGFFGWFSTMLALLSAILLAIHLLAPQLQLPPTVRGVVLGGFALAALLVVIAGFVDSRDVAGTGINSSRGAGYYLSLIVILAGTALAYLRLRETGGTLPWEKRRA